MRVTKIFKITLSLSAILIFVVVLSSTTRAQADQIQNAEFKDSRSLKSKIVDKFKNDPKKDSVIVKFKQGQDEDGTIDENDALKVDGRLGDREVVIKPKGGESADVLIDKLNKSGKVEFAEKNNKLKIAYTPDDSYYPQQWYLPKIEAPTVWDQKPGGLGPIAVIDTGVDTTHPDLNPNLNLSLDYDFVNGDNDSSDDNGHGTYVSGIISSVINNNTGTAGISENAEIIPIKALDFNGEGYESDIALAVNYAVSNGAKIINLSLGGYTPSTVLKNAVASADSSGVIVVAASGNDGISTVSYPAAYPGVLGVGGTDQNDARASFSNYGTGLDIMAPGTGIVSTYINGQYANGSGTSAAAPIVSGALSLIMSDGAISKSEALNRLKTTSDKVGPYPYDSNGYNTNYGYGRINLNKLANNITSTVPIETLKPVYRFWSSVYNHHFYTASQAERDHVIATWPNIWSYEGVAYYVSDLISGSCPAGRSVVYRFWSPKFNGHFYTSSEYEKNYVIATWPDTWNYEGPQYCVGDYSSGKFNKQVYRFWSNSYHGHFYTASQYERDHVIATWPNIWSYEGGVFWVGGAP